MENKKYVDVVCNDIFGSDKCITIAQFSIEDAQQAIDFALSIYEVNGSVRIEFEDY